MTDDPEALSDPVSLLLDEVLQEPVERRADKLQDLCQLHPERARALRSRMLALKLAGMFELPAEAVPEQMPERLGPFRLLRKLGGGGMGVVYLAEQEGLGRRVALKLVRPEHLYFPTSRHRFQREVEAVARLRHPGIVTIYTVGEEAGVPYFAMEWVAGCSLGEVLDLVRERDPTQLTGQDLAAAVARLSEPGGAEDAGEGLPAGAWADVACALARRIAEALAHAHARGIVHRDVKPSNVMLTPGGRLVLLDFGLAVAEGTAPITKSGALLGSLPYSSPEQVRGERVDERGDVYSLGALLYELVTLRQPFQAKSEPLLTERILRQDAPNPRRFVPGLSADLVAVLQQSLAKEPKRRYQTVAAMADDLRAVLDRRRVSARRDSLPERLARWAKREPVQAVLAGVLALAIPAVAAMGGFMVAVREEASAGREKLRLDELEAALGEGYLELGLDHADLASRAFERALSLAPKSPEAVAGMALTLIRSERKADAVRLLGQHADVLAEHPYLQHLEARAAGPTAAAARRQPPRPATSLDYFLTGVDQIERGDRRHKDSFRGALAALHEAILRSPRARPLFHIRYAQAAALAGDRGAAESVAAALAQLWPESAMTWLAVGFAVSDFDPARAVDAFHRAAELSPDNALAHSNRGVVLLRTGAHDEALRASRRAVELAPDVAHYRYNLALAWHQKRDFGQAEAEYRQSLELDPQLAAAHGGLGTLLLERGEVEAAVRELRAALVLDPEAGVLRATLGSALVRVGQTAEAVEACQRAAAQAPESAEVQAALGSALRAHGEVAAAVEAHRRAVELDARNSSYHYDLANSLKAVRDLRGAVKSYEQAIAIDDRFVEAHYNLATARRDLGDRDGAIRAFRRATELDPRLHAAWFNLANNLLLAGRADEAIAPYQKAIELEPEDADVHVNLGHAFAALGEKEQAARSLARAAELQPRDAATHEALVGQLRALRDWKGLHAELGRWATADDASAASWHELAAFLLSPRTPAEVRDSLEAVRAAQRAVDLSAGEDVAYLRTLAEAQLAHGEHEAAAHTAQRGLAKAPGGALEATLREILDRARRP